MALTGRLYHPGAPLSLTLLIMLSVWGAAFGQLRYSIPEEMKKGSFVGNVALDLGMDAKELSEGGARIVSRGRKQHFALNVNNGHLYINERIDRESLCAQLTPCLLDFEIIMQRTLKVYTVQTEVEDINDNSPTFLTDQIVLQVLENKALGARFPLPEAHDSDIGQFSVQNYRISPNKHFTLDVKTGADGTKYAELVLEKFLDREEQDVHQLILTATDGGSPVRSGTAHIRVNVIDVNDNAPVFNQSVYKLSVFENALKGTILSTIGATDIDQGTNSEITYSFNKLTDNILQKFHLDSKTGQLSLIESLDFEETEQYEFEVQASDGESLSRCKVLVQVINVNDNAPEILVQSMIKKVSENSPIGTGIALVEAYDRDAGEYGKVSCLIAAHIPFQLKKSAGGYYNLITADTLDREKVLEYNITITATDNGSPPLSKNETIRLQVSDVNDNPPVFDQTSYSIYVMENMPSGASIFRAKATDRDWNQNGKITYSIMEGLIGEQPLSSHISINSESGTIYAIQSFDFEEIRELHFKVKAQDGGSPALASNVTLVFLIQDQNDNTPEILHPSTPTDGSSGVEMAPRSSEPGYLITKVVAVDADSGQNAWLSYQILRSTEKGLFTVGVHTGEIRTSRPFMEKDAMKQMLVVLVKDNGQPPLSSSVTVTIALGDSLPEVVAEVRTFSSPTDIESDLTLYLVIAVSVVSFLFLFFVILLLVLRLRQWRESQRLELSGGNFLHSSQFVEIDGTRAFLQNYPHALYLTTDSGISQFKLPVSQYPQPFPESGASEQSASALVEDFLSVKTDDQPFSQFRPTTSEAAYDGRQRYLSNVILHKAPSSSTPST